MLRHDDASRADPAHYTAADNLRLGLYVHVDMPWFMHPFTVGSFKISSQEQIAQLRALQKPRFRYDPALSDVVLEASATSLASEQPPTEQAEARELSQAGDQNNVADDTPVELTRDAELRAYRLAALRTERAFMKALGVVRRLNRNLAQRPDETMAELGELVDEMVRAFLERPEVSLQVMGENCGGEEAYQHSLNVSVLCMMVAKGLALPAEQARLLGAAALLHDLGMSEIPDHVQKKRSDEQTRVERDLLARHTAFGATLGRQLALAPQVVAVMEQHHELADGSGYPHGLKLAEIEPLARIVSLVNHYDNLCNPRDLAAGMTPHEALSFIFARRRGQFDEKVLQILIRSLGVYPPGSIVRLSNDALAMVVSVNPARPLRPWVLPHAPGVEREDARLLNLERESDISISKALRPALVPAPILAWLSPRRRITYFFDAAALREHALP